MTESRKLALLGGDSIRSLRGAVEAMLNKLDATRAVVVVPADQPGFEPGASGRIEWGGQAIGHLGKVGAAACKVVDVRQSPTAAELDLPLLLSNARLVPQLKPLPRYPSVRRDLSLVVSEATAFEKLEQIVRDVNPPDLEAVEFVGIYRGKPLEKQTKSVTLTLVFRSPTATLTAAAVDASVGRVVEAAKGIGATLRGPG